MTKHEFKPVRWEGENKEEKKVYTEARTVKTKDLMNKSKQFGGLAEELTSKGLLQYVVLQRIKEGNGAWTLPTEQQFHDLITVLECDLLGDGEEILDVLQWTNMWDAVGVMGLSTGNIPLLKKFLEYVGAYEDDTGMEYSLVPKQFIVCLLYTSPSPRD